MNLSKKIIRIAIIGPESTGKSFLCEQLAEYYGTVWIPEFARKYLTALNRPYSLQDIVTIYSKQFEHEKSLLVKSDKFIFIDTEFIIAKVWCEHVFGECPDYIEAMIDEHPYDLYLLTFPDLPWVDDPLRENPGKGDFFFNWYESVLVQHQFPFDVVTGSGKTRLANAVKIVDNFLLKINNHNSLG